MHRCPARLETTALHERTFVQRTLCILNGTLPRSIFIVYKRILLRTRTGPLVSTTRLLSSIIVLYVSQSTFSSPIILPRDKKLVPIRVGWSKIRLTLTLIHISVLVYRHKKYLDVTWEKMVKTPAA